MVAAWKARLLEKQGLARMGQARCETVMDEGRIRMSDDPSGTEREAENQFWLEFLGRCLLKRGGLSVMLEMSPEEFRRLRERVTSTEPTQLSGVPHTGVAPGGGCCTRGDKLYRVLEEDGEETFATSVRGLINWLEDCCRRDVPVLVDMVSKDYAEQQLGRPAEPRPTDEQEIGLKVDLRMLDL